MSVVVSRQPFAEPMMFPAPEGATVAEIVRHVMQACPDMPPNFGDYCVARIGEHEIERCNWHRIRPANGAQVTVGVRMHGGETGKQVLTIVAAIAIVVATAYVGGPAFAATSLGTALTTAAGGYGILALQVGIGLVGTLAISALTPPPMIGNAPKGGQETLGSAGVNAQNGLSPLQQLPTIVGRMRVAPPIITPPFLENSGNDQYAHMIVGLAGRHSLSNILIAGKNAPASDAFTIQTFDGNGGPPTFTAVPRTGYTQLTNERLPKYDLSGDDTNNAAVLADQGVPENSLPKWIRLVTRDSPDEFHINLSFPVGMTRPDTEDNAMAIAVQFRARLRGTTAWRMLPSCVFVQQNRLRQSAFRKRVRLVFAPYTGTPPGSIVMPGANARTAAPIRYAPADGTSGAPAFAADPYFGGPNSGANQLGSDKVTTDMSGVNIWLDPTTATPAGQRWARGVYEIEVIISPTMNDTGVFGAASYPTTIHTNPYTWTENSKKVGPKGSNPARKVATEVIVENVTSIWNSAPVVCPGVACIAVRALNQKIEQLTVEGRSYAATWNGSTWSSTKSLTSNPAALLREVWMGPLNARPITSELIDHANLGEWYAYCNANSLECNLYWESGTVDQLTQAIAAAGHAAIRCFDRWGVIYERNRSSLTPVQIFTNRNIRNLSVSTAFPYQTQAIRATFNDRNDNYEVAEIFVYDAGFNAGNTLPGRIDAMDYTGKTSAAEVQKRARLDMRQARLRRNRYTFETSIEHFVATTGSLVGIHHDLLTDQTGAARIVSIIMAGANISGLVLDQPLPLNRITGNRGVFIRYRAGAAITTTSKQVAEADETAMITFTAPFANPGIKVGDLVSAAQLNQIRRCIVMGVEVKEDLSATVTLADEAPGIHPL